MRYYPVRARGGYAALPEYMGEPDVAPPQRIDLPDPMQWGSQLLILGSESIAAGKTGPTFSENVLVSLTSLDTITKDPRRIPYTQAIVLAVDQPIDQSGNFALRWVLQFGVGGGTTIFEIDASGVQQITVPANTVRISLVARQPQVVGTPNAFDNPDKDVLAAVFLADGTTATDGPTLTESFIVAASSDAELRVPAGATSFRICGDPNADNPYEATTFYQIVGTGTPTLIDIYSGDFLEDIRYASLPVSGLATKLIFTNTANGARIVGYVEWGIDL